MATRRPRDASSARWSSRLAFCSCRMPTQVFLAATASITVPFGSRSCKTTKKDGRARSLTSPSARVEICWQRSDTIRLPRALGGMNHEHEPPRGGLCGQELQPKIDDDLVLDLGNACRRERAGRLYWHNLIEERALAFFKSILCCGATCHVARI